MARRAEVTANAMRPAVGARHKETTSMHGDEKAITVLEAQVSKANWSKLAEAYSERTQKLPPGLVRRELRLRRERNGPTGSPEEDTERTWKVRGPAVDQSVSRALRQRLREQHAARCRHGSIAARGPRATGPVEWSRPSERGQRTNSSHGAERWALFGGSGWLRRRTCRLEATQPRRAFSTVPGIMASHPVVRDTHRPQAARAPYWGRLSRDRRAIPCVQLLAFVTIRTTKGTCSTARTRTVGRSSRSFASEAACSWTSNLRRRRA